MLRLGEITEIQTCVKLVMSFAPLGFGLLAVAGFTRRFHWGKGESLKCLCIQVSVT